MAKNLDALLICLAIKQHIGPADVRGEGQTGLDLLQQGNVPLGQTWVSLGQLLTDPRYRFCFCNTCVVHLPNAPTVRRAYARLT